MIKKKRQKKQFRLRNYSMFEKETLELKNPVTGAATIGLGSTLLTTIGAAISENNIYNEAITALTGGGITGAIAGAMGYCLLPNTNENSDIYLKIAAGVLHTTLGTAALVTAPLIGESCLGLGTDWEPTIVDGIIGGAAIIGGTVAIAGVVCACGGVAYCGNRFFSSLPFLSKSQVEPHQPLVPV